jgi:nucleotide-binding universal stress UspA family protein
LVVDHLRQHGVSATVEIASGQTNTESNIIKDRIDKGEFQLLVMGAYSHPRWFEFIFGGVTQSVMLSAPLPVLLSH